MNNTMLDSTACMPIHQRYRQTDVMFVA